MKNNKIIDCYSCEGKGFVRLSCVEHNFNVPDDCTVFKRCIACHGIGRIGIKRKRWFNLNQKYVTTINKIVMFIAVSLMLITFLFVAIEKEYYRIRVLNLSIENFKLKIQVKYLQGMVKK